jgi:hypothetical protein
VFGDLSAQSQQPPQIPKPISDQQTDSSGNSQSETSKQIKSTENTVSPVPITPTDGLQKESDANRDKIGENGTEFWPTFYGYRIKITDSLLAAFTLLLFFIGAWQGGHLRATVKAFISGERPYIYPGVFRTGGLLPTGAHAVYPLSPGVPFPQIEWSFMNVGKTPGVIKEVRGELFLGSDLPRKPTFTYSRILPAELIAREGQETDPMVFPFNRNLTLDEINAIGVGHIRFGFFGYIKYADSFRRLHTKGFAFRVRVHPHEHAEPIGGRKYNYSKSRKVPRRYDT